ncbi:MAG: glycosyltransferase family 2 protein [Lachnospiraceae bacterium]|nr:glycosyltransferase family 2 protein [Lachnospiraceae bacterium]
MQKIDVIIPTYKPDKVFETLIEKLEHQTVPVHQIILMNTEQKYFDQMLYGTNLIRRYQNITVHHISQREFDHGRTRHEGILKSEADIVILMTQDALPADDTLVERLIEPLQSPWVPVSYARQLPAQDCNEIEQFTRAFNYPDKSGVKSLEDLPELGIKTFFCSNVCAAYKRDLYLELGGFTRHTIFNEDMIFASGVIRKGYKIAYAADARVVHSHNYTCRQQFHRNFDLGVSQADHPEVFADVPSESEGVKMVKKTALHLCHIGKPWLIIELVWKTAGKYMGYRLGKSYKKLTRKKILKYTMNKAYWDSVYAENQELKS